MQLNQLKEKFERRLREKGKKIQRKHAEYVKE